MPDASGAAPKKGVVGRPPNPIPNVRRIFTLSQSDAQTIKSLAASLGISEGAVVRKAVRELASRQGADTKKPQR